MADVSFLFENGASSLTVSSATNYHLLNYDGIESVDIDFSAADNAQGDGAAIKSIRVPMRQISIDFYVSGETDRATVMGFFKPKVKYTLSVTRNSVTRKIYCYLATRPDYRQDNINLPIYITLELVCPDPYFFASALATYDMVDGNIVLFNIGDAPCGFVITITATGGAVVDPKVDTNITEDTYVSVSATLSNTGVMTISTVPGNCYVAVGGVTIYTYSLDSDFFLLQPGSNVLVFNAVQGANYIVAKISYYPRYLGV